MKLLPVCEPRRRPATWIARCGVCFLCAALLGAGWLAGGCAPFSAISPPPSGQTVAPDDSSAGPVPAAPPFCAVLEQLTQRAAAAAKDGEPALAHRLCLTVLEMLSVEAERETEETLEVDEYYRKVARIYIELLPAAYADSVDEAIAMLVFEGRMEREYDSISVSAGDTALARILACQRAASYDLPMVYNERVLKALAFLTRSRGEQVGRWIRRAGPYLPMIRTVLADSGLPLDLAYLPLIESGYNPRAYSYAHASGIWQFIASTGATYGLRRTYWIDERRDPVRSTQAAAAYLRKLYQEFNDWHLALAAYNCGENGVRRAIAAARARDYWSLSLPQQTMEYVPKFIAGLMLARNPGCAGLAPPDTTQPLADTVHVSECIDLGVIARGLRVDAGILEELNPHILRWCTPPDVDRVVLYLPPGTTAEFRRFVSSLPSSQKVQWQRYQVQPGDNLLGLAARFRTSVEAIRSVNKLRSNTIVAGRHLFIPVAARGLWSPPRSSEPAAAPARPDASGTVRYLVRTGETVSQIAGIFNTTVADICRWNNLSDPHAIKAGSVILIYLHGAPQAERSAPAAAPAAARPASGPERTYTVRGGDNMTSIAARLGVSVSDLCAWNGKTLSDAVIRVGEKLVYYGGTPQQAAESRTVARDTIHYQVRPGDNLLKIADLFYATVDDLARLNGLNRQSVIRAGDLLKVPLRSASPAAASSQRPAGRVVYYEVKKGDTLWGIAQLFGVPLQQIYAFNGLEQDARLVPGDTLRILLKEDL